MCGGEEHRSLATLVYCCLCSNYVHWKPTTVAVIRKYQLNSTAKALVLQLAVLCSRNTKRDYEHKKFYHLHTLSFEDRRIQTLLPGKPITVQAPERNTSFSS